VDIALSLREPQGSQEAMTTEKQVTAGFLLSPLVLRATASLTSIHPHEALQLGLDSSSLSHTETPRRKGNFRRCLMPHSFNPILSLYS
jgi:hypothetical protein